MWMGLVQSVEGRNKQKTGLFQEEGTLPAEGLWTGKAASALPWVSSTQANPADFRLASFCDHMSQFIKIHHRRPLTHMTGKRVLAVGKSLQFLPMWASAQAV